MNAYVFPGQGAQYPGMAKELYEGIPMAKDLLERANEILGFRITDIMFGGSAEDLKATKVTQPAIFLHSTVLAACYAALSDEEVLARGLRPFAPAMTAGHSLGEFSALTVAGAIRFEDALRLVSIRATQMQKCCEKVPGAMAAILGLPNDDVEQICVGCDGLVIPANYNCDGQIVVSGEKESVEQACAMAKASGAKRALMLAVSGAFHSPLMEPARIELGKAIEATEVLKPICPVYQNVTAAPETDPKVIKKNMLAQLTAPVKWTQSVKNMLRDGADYFMEMGPGTVLQGLVRKISAGQTAAGEQLHIEGVSTL